MGYLPWDVNTSPFLHVVAMPKSLLIRRFRSRFLILAAEILPSLHRKPGGWPGRVLCDVSVAGFIPVGSPLLFLWPPCSPSASSEVRGLSGCAFWLFGGMTARWRCAFSCVMSRVLGPLSSHFDDVSSESRHRLSLGGSFPRQRQQQIKATASLTSRFSQIEGEWHPSPERPGTERTQRLARCARAPEHWEQ